MRRLYLLSVVTTLLLPGAAFSQPLELDLVYPREETPVTAADSTFVFGSVSHTRARVLVNDLPMRVYSNGAFLGMVPVTPGEFQLHGRAVLDSMAVEQHRQIFVTPFLTTTPADTFAIDSTYLFPNEDLELMAGEYVQVAFKGTPGLIGSCTIPGLVEDGVMAETPRPDFYWGEAVFGDGSASVAPPVKGIYTGVFKIDDQVQLDTASVVFSLRGVDGLHLEVAAPGRLTVRKERVPQIAELTSELTVARTGPGMGYQQFLPAGVRLHVIGRSGSYLRVRLSENEYLWAPEANAKMLPPGAPLPESRVRVVRSEGEANKVRVRIYLQQRLPFQIEQRDNPSSLVLSIYGATADTDWIRYGFDDPLIRQMRWGQPRNGVYELTIELNHRQQWGYNPYYEDETLILEINKPPREFKFDKLLICIDPGHAPGDGAIGPTRLKEKDANLQLSLTLKEKLEDKGARVFLTRKGDYGASLAVRTKMATFIGADLLLSVHHNALPDGVNPFHNRGSSTYYYHVQSQPLAVAIQRRLLDKLELQNFGLYYDNLALCRPPQMPAVLIESAFIMHPEEERLIADKDFREKAADAIVKGIEDFLERAKEDH